jgi:hypothetical protein
MKKTYRHTAETDYGTFRADFTGQQYPLAVTYCGWGDMPEATKRRLNDKEGILYGWAHDVKHATQLLDEAIAEGCLNLFIVAVNIRELP